MVCTFKPTIGGKFAPLTGLRDEDMNINTMITTYNTAVIDAVSEILGEERHRKKPWVTLNIWLKPQIEEIIAEEQAGFRAGRSTTDQIFKLRILSKKSTSNISRI